VREEGACFLRDYPLTHSRRRPTGSKGSSNGRESDECLTHGDLKRKFDNDEGSVYTFLVGNFQKKKSTAREAGEPVYPRNARGGKVKVRKRACIFSNCSLRRGGGTKLRTMGRDEGGDRLSAEGLPLRSQKSKRALVNS